MPYRVRVRAVTTKIPCYLTRTRTAEDIAQNRKGILSRDSDSTAAGRKSNGVSIGKRQKRTGTAKRKRERPLGGSRGQRRVSVYKEAGASTLLVLGLGIFEGKVVSS